MKYHFEIIFQTLYDVGRSVNIDAIAQGFPEAKPLSFEKWRDTPESLLLPLPLIVRLVRYETDSAELTGTGLERLELQAKIYEEGVITLECRLQALLEVTELHRVKNTVLHVDGQELTPDQLTFRQFRALLERISSNIIQDQYIFEKYEREHYRIFCLTESLDDPRGWMDAHRDYLAPFLLGENPNERLHSSQVDSTLKTFFSFRESDLAVFDLDRAFLIDPLRDYEDLILIIEHANYQLLELRTLDKLLDRWLDEAEKDLRGTNSPTQKTSKHRPLSFHPLRSLGRLSQKLGNLQPLRLDALFILENLENSSRIIGDYYLEQIYDHLCSMFNTQGWKINVERRLELLQNIYTMTKSNQSERTMMILELIVVLMIALEIVALFFPQH
jgi:hypothetical protein